MKTYTYKISFTPHNEASRYLIDNAIKTLLKTIQSTTTCKLTLAVPKEVINKEKVKKVFTKSEDLRRIYSPMEATTWFSSNTPTPVVCVKGKYIDICYSLTEALEFYKD